MMNPARRNRESGQTRQEVLLVVLVCAVALVATLSVFVPGLRRLWMSIANATFL